MMNQNSLIWGVKFYYDGLGLPFHHKFMDDLLMPDWFSALRGKYEVLKVSGHRPKQAATRKDVNSYLVEWALGGKSYVIKEDLNCDLILNKYWKSLK